MNTRRSSLKLSEMRSIAKSRGGECLSTEYINAYTHLSWKCGIGHTWEATPKNVSYHKSWCPYCAGKRINPLKDMQDLAAKRYGKCLSRKYTDSKTPLRWECSHGHKWETTPASILNGRWCPKCSTTRSERICRAAFEQLFETPFPKSRPEWLLSPRGFKMELDGYSDKLGIAFEHQGFQHFPGARHFTETPEKLKKRLKYDALKRALCTQKGILLVEIPELHTRLNIRELKKFILDAVRSQGKAVPQKSLRVKLDFSDVLASGPARDQLIKIKAVTDKKRGKLISTVYFSSHEKLDFECASGHRFRASASNVLKGTWCPQCAGNVRHNIAAMQAMALERGGKCLSKRYRGNITPLLWECSEGHRWKASPGSIRINGSWCPKCAGLQKLDLMEMREIAKTRGGKCLSRKYVNANSKLLWECAKGHRWEAIPNSVKRGTWCKVCAGFDHLTLESAKKIAKERGGECLSAKYISARHKMIWRCANGHTWGNTLDKIKNRKQWCRLCSIESRRTKKPTRKV